METLGRVSVDVLSTLGHGQPWQQQSNVHAEGCTRRALQKVTLAVAVMLGGCHACWLCGLIPTFLLIR
jgi:Fe-S-cluster-containing hydrogenase component 2